MFFRLNKEIPISIAITITLILLVCAFFIPKILFADENLIFNNSSTGGTQQTNATDVRIGVFTDDNGYHSCSDIPDWVISSITIPNSRTTTGSYNLYAYIATGNGTNSTPTNFNYSNTVLISTSQQDYTFDFSSPISIKDVCQDQIIDPNNVNSKPLIAFGVKRVSTGSFYSYYNTSEIVGGTNIYMLDGYNTWDRSLIVTGTAGSTQYQNLIDLVFPVSTTTLSTNVDLYVDYYNDGKYDTLGFVGYYENDNFNTAFSATTTAEIGLITGDNINVDLISGSSVLWRAYLSSSATTTTPLYTDFENFWIVSNPYPELIGVENWDETYNLATTTCSILNISGCFQNAIVFLFKPSQGAFDLIIGLKDEIKYKPPFGYFYAIQTVLQVSTTTPAYTWEIPDVLEDLFSPIKSGFSWLLWILFGFWVIRTFSKLQV